MEIYSKIFKNMKNSSIIVKISYIFLVISYCLFIASILNVYNFTSSFLIIWLFSAFYFFLWPFITETSINKKLLNIFLVLYLILLGLFILITPTVYFIKNYVIFTILIILMAWTFKFKLVEMSKWMQNDEEE